MTEYTYFGNRGKLYIDNNAVAVLKGVEINVTMEYAELYAQSSILRQDVAKHTAKVEVKFKSAKFDPALGAGLSKIYGLVLAGDESGDITTTLTDTNDVALFDVELFIKGTGETNYTKITATNVYFVGLPFPAPENDFTVFDLTGYGDHVLIEETATMP